MSPTVLAKSMELAWALLESYDIDPVPLFQQVHIDPAHFKDPTARITQSSSNELWERAAKAINDPNFALSLGELWHPSHMHALGYAWLASSSLRTALNRLVRYIKVVSDTTVVRLVEKDNKLSVIVSNATRKKAPGWYSDGDLSIVLAMCRANYGDKLAPEKVTFRHHKPESSAEYYECFRCPVEFDAQQNSIIFTDKVVDKRLSGSNPMLAQLNDQVMVKYLAKLDENDIVTRVKATIIELLADGRLSDGKAAETLYMSNRTLQRKLQEQGTSFKKILTDVRQELALKYIQNEQMTLTELSFQLGFSEMSAFSRAFKNWTGKSPREFRSTA
jgi:AraC-like DNA-binding protein